MLALLWAAPVLGQDAHEDAAFEDSVWTALESRINALDVAEIQASPLNPSRLKMKPSAVLQATALDQIPATSRIEALTAMPGVDMVSNGAGTLRPVIRGLSGLNLIGGDVVEVAPPFDQTGNTALVGATMMFEILCVVAEALAARRR